jgi:hypothetical protein
MLPATTPMALANAAAIMCSVIQSNTTYISFDSGLGGFIAFEGLGCGSGHTYLESLVGK